MVSKTQAIKYIYTKCMKEGTSVREHVLDMMMHFDNAEVNGGAIDEANQVSFILESLPKSFIPFQTNSSLNKIEFTLTTLLNELQRFQTLTVDERSPLVGRALVIFSIVSGCTLVVPPTSSSPNLYFKKMGEGRCQKCRPKSSEYESQSSNEMHFKWFLTPDERSPLVRGALAIFTIVPGCTLVLPPTSSLFDLYFGKTYEG
ncbi:gag/pol protein [Cucumis melo var. makuwa]|uniref:Gag/pol protein n=1 Tax=Cucumis melo var. makuwa TaxID=1194695 RepID=A0A5D3BII7_CUCMM|nr:gag/pol protein [Cucumis melo var. makuwa]